MLDISAVIPIPVTNCLVHAQTNNTFFVQRGTQQQSHQQTGLVQWNQTTFKPPDSKFNSIRATSCVSRLWGPVVGLASPGAFCPTHRMFLHRCDTFAVRYHVGKLHTLFPTFVPLPQSSPSLTGWRVWNRCSFLWWWRWFAAGNGRAALTTTSTCSRATLTC